MFIAFPERAKLFRAPLTRIAASDKLPIALREMADHDHDPYRTEVLMPGSDLSNCRFALLVNYLLAVPHFRQLMLLLANN
jgi:hypothetical protein